MGPATREYANKNYMQFIKDMQAADLIVWHYRGRFYYEGPAVSVNDIQDALSHTKVKCQYDSLGLGFVVYPK